MIFDALIIGGGAAGLSCALVLGSAKDKAFAKDKTIGVITHQSSIPVDNSVYRPNLSGYLFDLIKIFDHRDVRAEAAPDRSKLQPDNPAADHNQLFRHFGQVQRASRRDDAFFINLDEWQRRRLRPGCDDDAFGLMHVVADLDLARLGDLAPALDVIDLVLLEEKFDAAGQFLGNLARAFHHGAPVVGEAVDAEAELARLVSEGVVELGGLEQGLGRDAAPVEAGATGAVGFDAGDFFTELGGANGGDVAGRAAPNDNQIVGHRIGGVGLRRNLPTPRPNVKGVKAPYLGRTQIFRKKTGFLWSCRNIGPGSSLIAPLRGAAAV